jgi:hypothetical protein
MLVYIDKSKNITNLKILKQRCAVVLPHLELIFMFNNSNAKTLLVTLYRICGETEI